MIPSPPEGERARVRGSVSPPGIPARESPASTLTLPSPSVRERDSPDDPLAPGGGEGQGEGECQPATKSCTRVAGLHPHPALSLSEGEGLGGEEFLHEGHHALRALLLGEMAGVVEAGGALVGEHGLKPVEVLGAEGLVLHAPEDEGGNVADLLPPPPEPVVPDAGVEEGARIRMRGHAVRARREWPQILLLDAAGEARL